MTCWFASLSSAARRADFWSRLCFIGLSAIVAACSAYGFFTEYDVWTGFTVASAGGVALAALCAISQFCSLNLSHQARRRQGRDRALCLVLMVVCGGWSAYGLHHFWDIVQLEAARVSGQSYVPVRSLDDIDGTAAMMMAICVAIAFVEPLTFWVLGGTPAQQEAGQKPRANVETLDPARRRTANRAGQRAVVAAAAVLAVGAMPQAVPPPSVPNAATTTATATRAVSADDVIRAADRLHQDGARVSFRRLAAELGVSKSKVERVLGAAGISIAGQWPPSRSLAT